MGQIYNHLVKILGHPISGGGNNPDFKCPHCPGKRPGQAPGRFHVDIDKDSGLCHKCGTGSKNLKALVVFLGGSDYKDRLRKESDVSLSESIYQKFFRHRKPEEKKEKKIVYESGIELPKEYQSLAENYKKDLYAETLFCNLTKRGITRKMIYRDRIGFCNSGRYDGNIIFPVTVEKKLVYFTTRRVFNAGGKTLNPYMPKRPILHNYDTCKGHKTLWVGEGPFDAYSFPQEGVAVLGSYMDAMQVDLFESMACEEIVLCLDPDAHTKMKEMADQLWKKYRETKTISMVFLHGRDDPNDLGPKKLQEMYRGRTKFGMPQHLQVRASKQEKKFLTKRAD